MPATNTHDTQMIYRLPIHIKEKKLRKLLNRYPLRDDGQKKRNSGNIIIIIIIITVEVTTYDGCRLLVKFMLARLTGNLL